MFSACHPVLSTEARVALTLRLLGGLTTEEIARAFLVPEPTIAQRIVRAKRTLAEARVPFEVPRGAELAARLSSVLEVIYLIFNEGYSATAGDDWMRPELCEEALRLGRILAGLRPSEPEVHGLVALMEIQASRARGARRTPTGEPVLLLEQNRARWDQLLIRRGLAALARAEALGGALRSVRAAGGDRRLPRARGDAGGDRLAAHRGALPRAGEVTPSPIVELNRAVAVGMADGPAAGLQIVDALPTSRRCELSPAAGRARRSAGEARSLRRGARQFERAASLTRNARERTPAARGRARGEWPARPSGGERDRRHARATGLGFHDSWASSVRRSRCIRMCAASAGVWASAIARSMRRAPRRRARAAAGARP